MTKLSFLYFIAFIAGFSGCSAQQGFRDSPASATFLVNFPATLSCTTLLPAPLVTWEVNGFQAFSGERISISYNATTRRSEYRISRVDYSDVGDYQCQAFDADGETTAASQVGRLTAQGFPAFISPLSPILAPIGGTASFECAVVSNPTATVTWLHESGSIMRNVTSTGRITISPPTMLTITNIQQSDAGYYICSAQNLFGRNRTSGRLLIGGSLDPVVVTLTPNTDPLIIRAGGSTTISCGVSTNVTILSFTWMRASGGMLQVIQTSNTLLLSITRASADDADTYTCTVIDSLERTSSQSLEVSVITPPFFLQEPVNVTATVGIPLQESLSCLADGEPSPVITWLRPDLTVLPIDPLTNAPQFQEIARTDAGTYTCLAANSAGEVRSRFTITVQGPPMFTTTPTDVTTVPGQEVQLACIAEGPPPPTYTWSRTDGSSLPSSSVTVGTDLHLFSVSSRDSGTYQCTAQNSFGSVMAQVRLNVLALRITSATTTPVVTQVGSSFYLNCSSTGPQDMVLNWYLNNTRLDPALDSNVVLQPNGTLIVNRPTINNTGNYICNVSTIFAFVISRVQVIVGTAPTITTSPRDADLTPGMGTFLNCTVSGFPSPRSSWFKTNLLTGRREELAVVGPTHVRYSNGLQLHNVGRDDNGMYQCVVHNALGMITNQATVRVGASPVVSSIQPTTFAVNGNVSLTCITSFNFPPGNISWVGLNGVSLSPARFLVNGSGVLTIFQVLRQDAGEISCTVTNQYGQSSITANIQVLFPPSVNVSTSSNEVLLDSTVSLSCVTEGQPTPSITWTLPDGRNALNGDNTAVNSATGQLTIQNTAADNIGTYTCRATNPLGSAIDSIQIIVRGPAIPGLSATALSTTMVRVLWSDLGPDTQSNVVNYMFMIRRVGQQNPEQERTLSFFQRVLTVSNLSPGVTYEVILSGVFVDSVTGLNSTTMATTIETAPSGSPQDFQVTPIEMGLYLQWSLPSENERNGVIVAYDIDYRQAGAQDAPFITERYTVDDTTADGGNFSLRGLEERVSYEIQISARTAVGVGPATELQAVQTLDVYRPGNYAQALDIVIGIGAALVGAALITIVILTLALIFGCYRRRTRAGKHKPIVNVEEGEKKKGKSKKKTVSGPIPGITPQVDSSVQGKFTVQGENGRAINLKPKIITEADVAPRPKKGDNVRKFKREDTILAPSNDESDEGRIDPYNTPADALKKSSVPMRQKSSTPVKVEKRESSGIYTEVTESMKPPSHQQEDKEEEEEEEEKGDFDDRPYEEMEHGSTGDMWRRGAVEESDDEGSNASFHSGYKKPSQDRSPSPNYQRPEAPDLGTDDSQLLYSSVSKEHLKKKREQKLREEQKVEEKDNKKEKKMQEKMERERKKMEEKQKKQREKEAAKERKRIEEEKKRRAKEQKKRESMGLSNIVSYQDIDFKSPGAKAQADFIDAATASMF